MRGSTAAAKTATCGIENNLGDICLMKTERETG